MPRHAGVCARYQRGQEQLAPVVEKPPEFLLLRLIQNGKAWQWVAFAAADCGRQPPDAAASGAELGDFLLGEFQQPVGRIGADGVERARLAVAPTGGGIGTGIPGPPRHPTLLTIY